MPAKVDLSGRVFGTLTVLKEADRDTQGFVRWLCQCSCGSTLTVRGTALTYDKQSCCQECTRKSRMTKRGLSRTVEHQSWVSMNRRCYETTNKSYPDYGAKGVTVCDEWRNDFFAFLAFIKKRPVDHILDRIDPFGNYEPGNVRWQPKQHKARNRRITKLTPEKASYLRQQVRAGKKMAHVAKELGIAHTTARDVMSGKTWKDN